LARVKLTGFQGFQCPLDGPRGWQWFPAPLLKFIPDHFIAPCWSLLAPDWPKVLVRNQNLLLLCCGRALTRASDLVTVRRGDFSHGVIELFAIKKHWSPLTPDDRIWSGLK
jgi:hypothetical protein